MPTTDLPTGGDFVPILRNPPQHPDQVPLAEGDLALAGAGGRDAVSWEEAAEDRVRPEDDDLGLMPDALQAAGELPPVPEDELARQALAHPGADGDPATPE